MIIVVTSLLPILAALALGYWLPAYDTSTFGKIALRIGQGVLMLFACGYLISAMNDSYYARTYWPSTPWQHSLGPDWPSDLFWDATHTLKLTGSIFVGTFFLFWGLRRSRAT